MFHTNKEISRTSGKNRSKNENESILLDGNPVKIYAFLHYNISYTTRTEKKKTRKSPKKLKKSKIIHKEQTTRIQAISSHTTILNPRKIISSQSFAFNECVLESM